MELEVVTYQQVIDGYQPECDDYGLAAYALSEPRKTAFLSNPNLSDTSKVMLKLVREDGKIIGRSMMFPSRFKVDDQIVDTVGGSALQVAKEYREGEAGGALMAYNIRHKENKAIISSGFSPTAAKCHKALRAYMLCFPQYIQIRNYRKVFFKLWRNKFVANVAGVFGNCLLSPVKHIIIRNSRKLSSHFIIQQATTVPNWVDEIVLNDGHKFMEVHDHKWFQWTLDNMFHDHEYNITKFFTVSLKDDYLGFFMIKERVAFIDEKSYYVCGTMCEWGTKDPKQLSEHDLCLLALNYFSDRVDVVYMATNDSEVKNKIKRLLFIRKGVARIAFYDLCKEYKEAKDINLWRVRIGYGDTILN